MKRRGYAIVVIADKGGAAHIAGEIGSCQRRVVYAVEVVILERLRIAPQSVAVHIRKSLAQFGFEDSIPIVIGKRFGIIPHAVAVQVGEGFAISQDMNGPTDVYVAVNPSAGLADAGKNGIVPDADVLDLQAHANAFCNTAIGGARGDGRVRIETGVGFDDHASARPGAERVEQCRAIEVPRLDLSAVSLRVGRDLRDNVLEAGLGQMEGGGTPLVPASPRKVGRSKRDVCEAEHRDHHHHHDAGHQCCACRGTDCRTEHLCLLPFGRRISSVRMAPEILVSSPDC